MKGPIQELREDCGESPSDLTHRVIDHLTATKLGLSSLRLHHRQGAVAPEVMAEALALIEQWIDAMAVLVHQRRAREASVQLVLTAVLEVLGDEGAPMPTAPDGRIREAMITHAPMRRGMTASRR